MVPKVLHDPEINKSRNSDSDYNFLDLSASYGSYSAFKYFLNKVPNSIIFKSSQITPLIFYALKGKNDLIIKEVIQKESTNENLFKYYDGLLYSLKLGNLQYLHYFFELAQAQRPDDDPETVLYDIFQSEEHKSKSPLKLAIKSRNIKCVAFILNISQREIPYLMGQQGKNKKRNALTPLHVAARYGCGNISNLLISLDPKMIKKKGLNKYFYPFVDAVKYNISPQNYEEYFKHGANKQINAKDSEGNAALHYAIKHANISAVNILLKDNLIDVNNRGEEDKTPIHLAAKVCSYDILTILLSNDDVDIFAKDAFDNWALHIAAESNWDEGFLMILQKMAKKKKEEYQSLHILHDNDLYKLTPEPSASFEEQQFKANSYMYGISSNQNNSPFGIDTYNNNNICSRSPTPRSSPNTTILPNFISSADYYSNTSNSISISNPISRQSSENDNDISFTNSYSSSSEIVPDLAFQQTNPTNFLSSAVVYKNNMQNNSGEITIPETNSISKEDQEEENDSQLLEATRDILCTKNRLGLCCFHVAAIKNCERIFDCLDKNYPTIVDRIYKEQSGLTGFTILHYMAMCGHSKLLDTILTKHGSRIDIDKHGIDPIVSALFQASKFNHPKCVQKLRLHGAQICNLTKRQRDVKQYVHSAFMHTLLFGDSPDKFELDAQDVYNKETNNETNKLNHLNSIPV